MTGQSFNEQVGLGHAHRAERTAALRVLRPGQDCCPYTWICGGLPMWPTAAAAVAAGADAELGMLDYDHYPGRIFGGPQVKRLAHRHCNRSAGQALGAQLRAAGIKRPLRKPRTRTPGTPTARRARRRRWGI